MYRTTICGVLLTFLLFAGPATHATVMWDSAADYSTTNNPNGVWQYGRKNSAQGASFDLLFARWGSSGTVPSGGFGWYLDNWGHGGPSMLDGDGINGPYIWAKDNSNGLPSLRWVSPAFGTYQVTVQFTGADSRGVDNYVYVAVNDLIVANGRVTGNLDVAAFTFASLTLGKDDHIDLVAEWAGGVSSEIGWTEVTAVVSGIPVAPSMPLLISGLLAMMALRPAWRKALKPGSLP